ncbi:MAG: 30S ribosomal protein S19 [bacterium]|nr:30S ribosomal protein S19 [bacterium]
MSRSLKKGPYIDERLLAKLKKVTAGSKSVIKTWSRGATISPEMVGYTFGVHNGREHIPVLVSEQMVGHKLGEFSSTRKFISHGGRMAKEESAAPSAPSPAASTDGSADKASKVASK